VKKWVTIRKIHNRAHLNDKQVRFKCLVALNQLLMFGRRLQAARRNIQRFQPNHNIGVAATRGGLALTFADHLHARGDRNLLAFRATRCKKCGCQRQAQAGSA